MKKFSIIISSKDIYSDEIAEIKSFIEANFDFVVEKDLRDLKVLHKESLGSMINSLGEKSIIFLLLGKQCLLDAACVEELNDIRKNLPQKFVDKSIVFLLNDIVESGCNIRTAKGRRKINESWERRIHYIENEIAGEAGNDFNRVSLAKRKEFLHAITSIEKISRIKSGMGFLIDFILKEVNSIPFENFSRVLKKSDFIKNFFKGTDMPAGNNTVNKMENSLEYLFSTIKINDSKNPKFPEFPPKPFYLPRFPASMIKQINVDGFKNVFIKDESTNPTGSHKDRMALEIVMQYKALIESLKFKRTFEIPKLSIISSGSAALSIQHMLNLYRIPTRLRVLHDKRINEGILRNLSESGCILFPCELSEAILTSEEIKSRTDNENGIDLTYREILDPNSDNYYDWMSYEIINQDCDFCLIPFGTGDLFVNVLKIAKREHLNSLVNRNDSRYLGNVEILRKANYLGATTHFEQSKLVKLYSDFLPFEKAQLKYIEECKKIRCCGSMTGVFDVNEDFVEKAMKIATENRICCEYSGIAGLALLLQMKQLIPVDAKILIVNTGRTKLFKEIKKEVIIYYKNSNSKKMAMV